MVGGASMKAMTSSRPAVGADQRVDLVHFLNQPGPAAAAFPAEVLALGVVAPAIGPAGCEIGAGGHLAALAAGGVGVVAKVVSRMFSRIGNVLGHQGDPLQGVQVELGALGRLIMDSAGGRVVFDPAGGEDGAADVGAQALQRRPVVRFHGFGR